MSALQRDVTKPAKAAHIRKLEQSMPQMPLSFIFIGGTYRGYRVLQHLLNSGYIPEYAIALQQEDHEHNRFTEIIAALLSGHGIPYRIGKKLNESDKEIISARKRDFAIVCGWRTIIDTSLSEYFKLGFVAAHDSLLPKYRGFAPINWTIINGETQTGVTLFLIRGYLVDSGPVLLQTAVEIENKDYAIDILLKVTEVTVSLYSEFIVLYQQNLINLTEQNEEDATYTCIRMPDDSIIDWSDSSIKVYNFIRALAHPYPGATCHYNGEMYKIRRAAVGEKNDLVFSGRIPGRVINVTKDGIEVLCGTGTLFISEWEHAASSVIENPSQRVKSIKSTLK